MSLAQFVELHDAVGDKQTFPPKRTFTTSFLPSAWARDELIDERKSGLTMYINNLLRDPKYGDHSALTNFLSSDTDNTKEVKLEDMLPSTMSLTRAFGTSEKVTGSSLIAAAYYPDWSAGTNPPEKLDFAKFDILYFGEL